MKLTVQVVDVPSGIDGKALVLCTEDGEPLPGQVGVRFEHRLLDQATLDVTFVLGRDVILGPGVAPHPAPPSGSRFVIGEGRPESPEAFRS